MTHQLIMCTHVLG